MANYRITVRTADGDISGGECAAIDVPDRVNELAQVLGGMTIGASMSYATPLTWSFLIERTRIYIVAEEIKAAITGDLIPEYRDAIQKRLDDEVQS